MMAEGEGRERRKEGDLVFWLCAYISVLSCEYSTPVHSQSIFETGGHSYKPFGAYVSSNTRNLTASTIDCLLNSRNLSLSSLSVSGQRQSGSRLTLRWEIGSPRYLRDGGSVRAEKLVEEV